MTDLHRPYIDKVIVKVRQVRRREQEDQGRPRRLVRLRHVVQAQHERGAVRAALPGRFHCRVRRADAGVVQRPDKVRRVRLRQEPGQGHSRARHAPGRRREEDEQEPGQLHPGERADKAHERRLGQAVVPRPQPDRQHQPQRAGDKGQRQGGHAPPQRRQHGEGVLRRAGVRAEAQGLAGRALRVRKRGCSRGTRLRWRRSPRASTPTSRTGRSTRPRGSW